MKIQQWRQHPKVVDVTVAVALLVGIALTAHYFTQEVLLSSWEQEGILYEGTILAARLFGSPLYVYLSVLGIVVGLSAVWVFDTYKRYQVFAPLALVAVVAHASGTFHGGTFGNLSIGAVSFLFVSTVVGAQIGGLPLYQYWFGSAQGLLGRPPVSFPQAPKLLFVAVFTVVAVGLIDVHIDLAAGPTAVREFSTLPIHGVTGLLLVGFFYKFTQYDSEVKIVQLGPARSGKTSMLGGLAADVNRDAREGDGSGAIDDVRYSLEERREFPPPTDDISYYEFSYMSGRPVFRKRNTISTLDYSGEKLTGGGNGSPLSDEIISRREQRGNRLFEDATRKFSTAIPFLSAPDPWAHAIEELEDDRTGEMKALARLVESANVVVFTVPIDDFLTRAIERENTPPYLEEVRLIEPTDEANEFLVRRLDGSTDRVGREGGELIDVDSGEPYTDAEWETLEDLPEAVSGERYYLGRDRSNRDRYKEEYKDLIRLLNEDLRKSFSWTTTMTDLVNEDFETVYQRAVELVRKEDHDPGLEPYVERVREAGLFEPNATEFAKHDRQGRQVHARWVQREYVETAWPEFEGMLEDTFEEFVYPVWFEIDEDRPTEDLSIRIDGGRTLQGSDLVLDRFEGRELIENEPVLGDGVSLTEAGYRILYAASQQDDEDDQLDSPRAVTASPRDKADAE